MSLRKSSLAVLAGLASTAPSAFAGFNFNTLTIFDGNHGSSPGSSLVLSGNTLYGTTQSGGDASSGEVFSLPVTGGTPTVLYSFTPTAGQGTGDPAVGYEPGGLIISGSTLYGVTQQGGGNNDGAVFSLPISGGTATLLSTLTGTTANPFAALMLNQGTLYGTSTSGGNNGVGGIFSVPVTGGTPTLLASLDYSTSGATPNSSLLISGGKLYGTASLGGSTTDGTVFSVPIAGGTPSILTTFNKTDGREPYGGLTLVGTTLYGTTHNGNTGDVGEVFSLPIGGGTPATIASFSGTDVMDPFYGNPILSPDGTTLYVAGQAGGLNSWGGVFSVPIGGGSTTTLHSFDVTDGYDPIAGLTIGPDGSLYGAAYQGGSDANAGTVFALTVPEPATLALLGIPAALSLLHRRRDNTRRES